MENFVNLAAGRVAVNLLGAEGVTTKTLIIVPGLQHFGEEFGGSAFGLPESDDEPEGEPDAGDAGEEKGAEPAGTKAQAPETTPQQAQATGEPATARTGEPDPLAKFRSPDGTVDYEKLTKSYLELQSGYGKLDNDVGALRAQLAELQAKAQQAAPPAQTAQPEPEINWDEINARLMEEFAENPAKALLSFMQAYGSKALAPFQEFITRQQAMEYITTESDKWWQAHSDLTDEVKNAMAQEYEKWQEYLQQPNPQDPTRPLIPPDRQLDLLLAIVRGQSAPQAIQQAAEAAAQAAAQTQAEKVAAHAGTGAKAPTSTHAGDSVLEGLKSAAREQRSVFLGN